ncbi:peroxiredoxin-5, mitochondrial [Chrysoperla carnea]|uniref:peroxiredoxin-5, mitochondrial n=1 Tax=Chrysoperla carnea TaxID=189513 RepID=UPI001D0921EE|nr:peroxiredoxin-5, mitochondrial [Chrysoperla carnea]
MSCTRVLASRIIKVSKSITNNIQARTMAVQVGSQIPQVELQEGSPATKVNLTELCAKKKVVIFGVPGAFTPGCSKTHLPGYIERADELKKKGIDEIVCVSANDAFVMQAWADDQKTEGKVRMLADPNLDFIKALGLEQNLAVLGGLRSKRFSMVVEDNKITQLNVEPDGTGLSCSLAKAMEI